MGNLLAWQRSVTDPPGINPGPNATPTFDPMFGFKEGRKERGTLALYTHSLLVSIAKLKSVVGM